MFDNHDFTYRTAAEIFGCHIKNPASEPQQHKGLLVT